MRSHRGRHSWPGGARSNLRVPEAREKLRLRQMELISLAENHTRQYSIAVRRLYEVGNKAGKLLAWLEQKDRECVWVLRVENSELDMQTTGAALAETFADYYKSLYASMTDMSTADFRDFPRDIQLQELQKDNADTLEGEMMEEEVTLALLDLQKGRLRPEWDPSRAV
ncbi:hypothetical protein NDU88_006714 [Pleurodeles waltl]|uniref:Uncharacterized protein n=1 Tax=Pleurodeles waltl TaxID=8319 RepID=A0AAV7QMR2_PLEWA|nr:hypothetical protein NDU88_006714 [Pleurodeles waltl]